MASLTIEFNFIREIADASLDGVIIYSVEYGNIIYSNERAVALVGLHANSSRLEIKTVFEQVARQDKEYLINQFRSLRDKTSTGEIEFELILSNKASLFLCCNAYLIANKSAIIVFLKDITKSKEHEEYIIEFGARKNTVLASLAHQVSGALTLMQHLSSEAEQYVEVNNNETLAIYLTLLKDNSRHCLDIIYDLLKSEHQLSPAVALKNSRIDIIHRIAIIYDELAMSYQKRKFIFKPSIESLYLDTDEVKLLQVVNNLLSNAIKFSDVRSPIVIDVLDEADRVVVSVTDSGIGIPEDLKPFIFKNQFNVGRRGLNGERSLGLGLSICKNLVSLLGGEIWFESAEGKGSTFYFSLPMKSGFKQDDPSHRSMSHNGVVASEKQTP
jgi:two-component system sensor histidine kinase VicK